MAIDFATNYPRSYQNCNIYQRGHNIDYRCFQIVTENAMKQVKQLGHIDNP